MGYVSDLRAEVGSRPLVLAGAAVIVLDDEGRILVQLRRDMNLWGLPGGAVELNESVEQTAAREVLEEVGVTATELELLWVASGPEYHVVLPNGHEVHNVSTVFLCRGWKGEPRPDGVESLDVGWIDPAGPDRPITAFLRRLLADLAPELESARTER